MTEPTITCPNCKTEIRLTESLAAPLIAATRDAPERYLDFENSLKKYRRQPAAHHRHQSQGGAIFHYSEPY